MTPQHLLVFCIIALIAIEPSASEIDCIIEDFEDGSLGSFSDSCFTQITSPFVVKVYNESFKPPSESEGFYATTANGDSCMRYNKKITGTDGFKLTFNLFMLSESEKGGWCYAIAFEDSDVPTVMDVMILFVAGDGGWKIKEVKFDNLRDGDIFRLEIVCQDLGQKDSFLAIDYIEIGSSNPEDCKQTTTTILSTTTLITTTTLEPDTTTTTEPDTTTTPNPDTTTTSNPDTTTTPNPDTTDESTIMTDTTTNTETTEDSTTPETTESTTLTESTVSTTTDTEITTEDSETTSDDSIGGTSPDTTIPSVPKPPNNSDKQLRKLMSIIGICIGSALTIWLIVLTISSIHISTIPVDKQAGIKNDVGTTIPRLQVQRIQMDDVGRCVIDIRGSDSKRK